MEKNNNENKKKAYDFNASDELKKITDLRDISDEKFLSLAASLGENATDKDIEDIREKMDSMKRGVLEKSWGKVVSLWKKFISPETPKSLKALIIGSLIYMVMPIDIIPDVIPFAGLLDDVALISLVYLMLDKQTENVELKKVSKSKVGDIGDEGKIRPGDIVMTQRLLYQHYGVYIGGGEVIHFNNREGGEISGANNDIIQTGMEEFLKGDELFVVKEKEDSKYKPFSPEETIERAKSCLGKYKGTYDLINHNCEHFAYWCRYGVSESSQVDSVINAVKILTATMILI